MAYKEWGDPANPDVLLCVHGVTRVADDFDVLAARLCDRYRIVCPDVVGRGRSGWLADPQGYQLPQYIADMVTLIARLDVTSVRFLGTSMGGLIGMALAALGQSPVRTLVLNDVGPALNFSAISRIAEYIAQEMRFATFEEGEQFVRAVSRPFGPHDEAQWHKLAHDVLRQNPDGSWRRHYDPGLALPMRGLNEAVSRQSEILMWAAYDAIRCPTLLLRGEQSDLLSADIAHAMTQRGPRATLVEFPGVGHAPTLVHDDQIAAVSAFLLSAS